MKKLAGIVCVILSLAFVDNYNVNETISVSINDNSTLTILGTTNINSFTCILNFYQVNNSNINTRLIKTNNRIYFEEASMKLQNSCFDCGNRMMNEDFEEMLNSSKYPTIDIQLKEVVINQKNKEDVYAFTTISMAGTTKSYSVPLTVVKSGHMRARGCLSLKLTEYGIEPPKKALGLVVVSEEVDINFDLLIQTQ